MITVSSVLQDGDRKSECGAQIVSISGATIIGRYLFRMMIIQVVVQQNRR